MGVLDLINPEFYIKLKGLPLYFKDDQRRFCNQHICFHTLYGFRVGG